MPRLRADRSTLTAYEGALQLAEALGCSPSPSSENRIELSTPVCDLVVEHLDLPITLEQLAMSLLELLPKASLILLVRTHG